MNADRLVLDTSVAIAWFFSEAESQNFYAASVLRLIDDGAKPFVPALFHIEVAEFLMRRRRTPSARFSQARLDAVMDGLDALGLQTVSTVATYRDIASWAREYHVQAKDTPFVRLAAQEGLPLATLDGGQRQAAKVLDLPLVAFN